MAAMRFMSTAMTITFWIQLRRDVPTKQVGRRSRLRYARSLWTAHKLGLELVNIAERNKQKSKAKAAAGQKTPKPKGAAS